jgi:hypothetical protein
MSLLAVHGEALAQAKPEEPAPLPSLPATTAGGDPGTVAPTPSAPAAAPAQVAEEPSRSASPAAPATVVPETPPASATAGSSAMVTPFGYVEASFAWNGNRPSNGVTAYRGFDNRHASFMLQNAVLGANAQAGSLLSARVALQVGTMPASYYLAEPLRPGSSSVATSDATYWRHVQEAFLQADAPVGKGLRFQLGTYLSPVGFESVQIKENPNWSHSNLFFGLPYYHTGLRVSYPFTDKLRVTAGVFNGWNSVIDNNEAKSVELSAEYEDKENGILVDAVYLGGVERPDGAPEGPAWRHLFDASGKVDVTDFLTLAAHANYGFERNRFGTASWWAAALYAKVSIVRGVRIALRGDRFHEHLATAASGTSSPVFWGGAEWVTSGTATLEAQPFDNLVVRLEGRHDVAEVPLYYKGGVAGDGSDRAPFLANARTQTTATLGATVWF